MDETGSPRMAVPDRWFPDRWSQTGKDETRSPRREGLRMAAFFFLFFITLGLELSDTNVYEP